MQNEVKFFIQENLIQIEEQFKKGFQTNLNSGKILNFEELLKKTLALFEINHYDVSLFHNLKLWILKITELSFIDDFLKNENINEIIIHSNQFIQIEINGQLENIHIKDLSAQELQLTLEVMALSYNQSWNFSSPFASFFINHREHLFRASMIHYSTTPLEVHSKIFLRRIKKQSFELEKFNLNTDLISFFEDAVANKKNMIIAGATGSGKTSFMKSLLNLIEDQQHVLVLEDTYELQVDKGNFTSLLSKDMENKKLMDYLSYGLRMRPDRIIIGELRSTEIVPFMMSMNTGHGGLVSTIHANSCLDTINRLALLFSMYSPKQDIKYATVLSLICKNLDYIVHMDNKNVVEIIKPLSSEGDTPYFETIYEPSREDL